MEIYLDSGSLDKMKITSSERKYYLVISGKGLITYLGLKTIRRSNKNKKGMYAITDAIMKDTSNIIKEVEKLSHEGYLRKRPKYEPTDS